MSRCGLISAITFTMLDPEHHPELEALIDRALTYNRDFIAPTLNRRAPGAQ